MALALWGEIQRWGSLGGCWVVVRLRPLGLCPSFSWRADLVTWQGA